MRLTGPVEQIVKRTNAYKHLIGKPERKGPIWTLTVKDNIKMECFLIFDTYNDL
jgi:hypothetical protein